MVTPRVLTTDVWPLWRTLRLAALTDAPNAFKVRLADWDRGKEERWRARLELPGAYHVAALLDGHAVGVASGLPGAADIRELRSVWVSSEARGHGIEELKHSMATGACGIPLGIVSAGANTQCSSRPWKLPGALTVKFRWNGGGRPRTVSPEWIKPADHARRSAFTMICSLVVPSGNTSPGSPVVMNPLRR
ncbi:GNAT family N-acetyltransferase [Streptomyces acidicola]|uniref:GNAT family N-acetyltransferase n=1 Tax=Streptomyces acidicola TaxID=2596892 RepID=UPI001883E392|nr:GNAT family N-acetyltransferase [Streptomyces acidicola]